MQQKVCGKVPTAVPVGTPPPDTHEPPLGGVVTVNFELPREGLPGVFAHEPAGKFTTGCTHWLMNVSPCVVVWVGGAGGAGVFSGLLDAEPADVRGLRRGLAALVERAALAREHRAAACPQEAVPLGQGHVRRAARRAAEAALHGRRGRGD